MWEFWEEMWLSPPLWSSGILGNMGILGRDVAEHTPVEFRNSGKFGNYKRDVAATPHVAVAVHPCGIPEFREIWEFWEEMWLSRHTSSGCGCTPPGISEMREIWEF